MDVLAAIERVKTSLIYADLRPVSLAAFLEPLNAEESTGRLQVLDKHVEGVLGRIVVHLACGVRCAKDRLIHERDDARCSAAPLVGKSPDAGLPVAVDRSTGGAANPHRVEAAVRVFGGYGFDRREAVQHPYDPVEEVA